VILFTDLGEFVLIITKLARGLHKAVRVIPENAVLINSVVHVQALAVGRQMKCQIVTEEWLVIVKMPVIAEEDKKAGSVVTTIKEIKKIGVDTQAVFLLLQPLQF
jgi:hypothetical protein